MSKAEIIARLKAQFDKDVKAATTEYNTLVQKITRTRLPASVKRTQLLTAQKAYNNKINALKSKLAMDIAAVPDDPAPAPSSSAPLTPKKCALLVGLNYRNTANELYGCINDVYNMEKFLKTKRGFTTTTIITDDTVTKPTRSGILSSLENLIASGNPGDTLLFHYSGHGTQTPDRNGDEADGLDEELVPLDFNCIKDDELRAIFAKGKAGVNIFILLDCCHSGSGIDLKYGYMDGSAAVVQQNSLADMSANVTLISGCKDSQTSADAYIGGASQGAMTWAFLQSVSAASSWRVLLTSMRQSLSKGGYTQVPQLSAGSPLNLDSDIKL